MPQPDPVFTKHVDYVSSPGGQSQQQEERSAYVLQSTQPQWPANYSQQYSPTSSLPSQRPQQQQQQQQKTTVPQEYAQPNPSVNVPANTGARYSDPNDVPVNLTATKYRHRPWHYSLCVLCKEMDSCAESCCCLYCQLSRQCNMFVNNKHQIHWPYCVLMSLTDLCTAHMLVTWIFSSQTRRLARERYGVSGSCCNDCCVGCWCRTCSTQQVLLEMTVMNDFPGATCYNAIPQPMNFEMV